MPCIQLGLSDYKTTYDLSADLPTRLAEYSYYQRFQRDSADGKVNSNFYRGILPPFKRKWSSAKCCDYASLPVEVVNLPFDKQLVVDGYMCPASCFDPESGKCQWDRDEDENEAMAGATETDTPTSAAEASKDVAVSVPSPTDDGEGTGESTTKCPICAYIESGPCKMHFNCWEKCIDALKPADSDSVGDDVVKCAPETQEMMKCFLKYEHYDIMVASLQDSIKDAFGSAPLVAKSDPVKAGDAESATP